jgi:hypothetical protein
MQGSPSADLQDRLDTLIELTRRTNAILSQRGTVKSRPSGWSG